MTNECNLRNFLNLSKDDMYQYTVSQLDFRVEHLPKTEEYDVSQLELYNIQHKNDIFDIYVAIITCYVSKFNYFTIKQQDYIVHSREHLFNLLYEHYDIDIKKSNYHEYCQNFESDYSKDLTQEEILENLGT